MTQPPLELMEGQLVRVEYQEGRTQWWWAHYDDASVRPGEIGMLLGRTSDRWFENYRVRLIGRGHDVTFAARELNPCNLAAENAALRAQAEAEANERARLSNVLERDRTQVAGGVITLGRVLEGYQWLTEGRGPYAYDDDRYQQEFGNALRDLAQALEPLRLIGHDLTDCPTLWADVQSARRGLSAPAQADAGGEA